MTSGRRGRRYQPATERFWAKVDKNGPVVRPGLGRCWIWVGAHWRLPDGGRGYGSIHVGGKRVKCHRFAWELHNGPIPDGDGYHGTCVCHRCDNPACVNPDHLFLGTAKDNAIDAVRKGRRRGPNSIAALRTAFAVALQEEESFPEEASGIADADEVLFGELSLTTEEP